MATTLPTGLTEDDVERAIDAFAHALGADAVTTDSDELREFRDPYAYRESDEWDASAAVAPTSTEQVQSPYKCIVYGPRALASPHHKQRK